MLGRNPPELLESKRKRERDNVTSLLGAGGAVGALGPPEAREPASSRGPRAEGCGLSLV